jgi:hypothetical protein
VFSKPTTLDCSTTTVSVFDPSIDMERSDFDAYREVIKSNPAGWREHIKPLPGEHLTVFHIGVIEPTALTMIEEDCGMSAFSPAADRRVSECQWRCFMAGLRDIEGWYETPRDMIPKIKRDGVEYVDPSWIRRTFTRWLRRVGIDVGCTIWMYNQAGEEDLKKSSGRSKPTRHTTESTVWSATSA